MLRIGRIGFILVLLKLPRFGRLRFMTGTNFVLIFFKIIFDQYNEITLKGKIKIFDKSPYQKDPIKRKFTPLIGDDDNSEPESELPTAKINMLSFI